MSQINWIENRISLSILFLTALILTIIILRISLNLVALFRYFLLVAVGFSGTAFLHIYLGEVYHKVIKDDKETIREHYLYYVPAYISWMFLDAIMGAVGLHYVLNKILFDLSIKGFFCIFSIIIIHFYSSFYFRLQGKHLLYMDLAGMLLAMTIAFHFTLCF